MLRFRRQRLQRMAKSRPAEVCVFDAVRPSEVFVGELSGDQDSRYARRGQSFLTHQGRSCDAHPREKGRHNITIKVDQTPLPKEMGPPAVAAQAEVHGEGVLFPALVIGLGGLGLQRACRVFALLINEHFGSVEAFPTFVSSSLIPTRKRRAKPPKRPVA